MSELQIPAASEVLTESIANRAVREKRGRDLARDQIAQQIIKAVESGDRSIVLKYWGWPVDVDAILQRELKEKGYTIRRDRHGIWKISW